MATAFKLHADPQTQQLAIVLSGGELVYVYDLHNDVFEANPERLQLYGTQGAMLLAFEAPTDISDILEFGQAVDWYGRYLKCPGMRILVADPRNSCDCN